MLGTAARMAGLALVAVGLCGCAKQPAETTPAVAAAPSAPETPAEQAVALYDSGRYDEARPILESLDAQGLLDGPGLYRLGYCYGAAGDAGKQAEIMTRALAALEAESKTNNRLDVAFFLANSQTNLGKTADARATATAATAEVDAGKWPRPTGAIDSFRLAKLYADQGRKDAATEWYGRALDRFEADGATAPGYKRWARRWLAQEAFARGDHAEAERQYAGLAEAGGATPAEFDRLATSAVRQAHWTAAADAWREAEKLDPANADRARYCRNLVRLAESAGTVPATDPSHKAWSALSKEDLERTMAEQAGRVRDARVRLGETPPPDPAARAEMAASLAQARSTFVAAALEYALRDHDIRETAFLGGYAPLIFHPEEWTLPEEEPGS